MFKFPLVRMLVESAISEYTVDSIFKDCHTLNASQTYDNICSFSEVNLMELENVTRKFVDDNGYRVEYIPYYACSGSYTTTSPTTPMPKFKKGDVIICNRDCNTSGHGWCVEKGEKFYVQQADHDTYWLRVVYSSDGNLEDFSVPAYKIDDSCSLYNDCSNKSSNSYFPNLSNV